NLGTNQDEDLKYIQDEIDNLVKEINGIAERTQFNGKTLLNGSFSSSALIFQIGANQARQLELTIASMNASALSVSGFNVASFTTTASINTALSSLDADITKVSGERSKLGATQNRLEHTIRNLDNAAENLPAAESRIRDVDMAKEMMEFTKQTILQQASTAMLAQANNVPQTVLQLLR